MYTQNRAMSKHRIQFRDGSVLEVSLSGAESPTLRVLKRKVPAVAHAAEATNADTYRGLDAPEHRSLGTGQNASEDEAEEEDDEAYEEGREEEYDASIVQTDSAPVPQPRERSRAAMLLPYVEDIFRVMNQPRHTTSEEAYFDAQTNVLMALDTLMAELDPFLGLDNAQRYQPLLLGFRDVILQHFSCGVEGDGESGLSAESQRSHKRRRTEDGDERCV